MCLHLQLSEALLRTPARSSTRPSRRRTRQMMRSRYQLSTQASSISPQSPAEQTSSRRCSPTRKAFLLLLVATLANLSTSLSFNSTHPTEARIMLFTSACRIPIQTISQVQFLSPQSLHDTLSLHFTTAYRALFTWTSAKPSSLMFCHGLGPLR